MQIYRKMIQLEFERINDVTVTSAVNLSRNIDCKFETWVNYMSPDFYFTFKYRWKHDSHGQYLSVVIRGGQESISWKWWIWCRFVTKHMDAIPKYYFSFVMSNLVNFLILIAALFSYYAFCIIAVHKFHLFNSCFLARS